MTELLHYRHVVKIQEIEVADLLTSMYAEIYADMLDDPFFSVARFRERLRGHVSAPNWGALIGYEGDQAVGYAYGSSVRSEGLYWTGITPEPDSMFAEKTGDRTFVLYELMIREPWRKTGAARAIHDALLATRNEERVSLAVEHEHSKVRKLYQSWGYSYVGSRRPSPDAPVLDIMVRPIHPQPSRTAVLRDLSSSAAAVEP